MDINFASVFCTVGDSGYQHYLPTCAGEKKKNLLNLGPDSRTTHPSIPEHHQRALICTGGKHGGTARKRIKTQGTQYKGNCPVPDFAPRWIARSAPRADSPCIFIVDTNQAGVYNAKAARTVSPQVVPPEETVVKTTLGFPTSQTGHRDDARGSPTMAQHVCSERTPAAQMQVQ